MMVGYDEAKEAHLSNIFEKFNDDPTFLYINQFMKRGQRELQQAFLSHIRYKPKTTKQDDKFREVYEYVQTNNLLNEIIDFIRKNRELSIWYSCEETQRIIQELHKLPIAHDEFSPINSIDKQLFSKVQKATTFKNLKDIIITINNMLEKKVYWNYYNTQTTRIIEDIFSSNDKVIPTLVDTKGVDFFIDELPIDLKITKVPAKYSINDILQDKDAFIKWLYENQSEQRFSANNRLFLILNDKNNPQNSEKLKITHYEFIRTTIDEYLDNFSKILMRDISFIFKDKIYRAKSDLILINI